MSWAFIRPKGVRRLGTLFSVVLALSTPVFPIPALTGADAPARIPMTAASALAAPAQDQVGVVDQSQGLWSLRDDAGGTFTFYFGNPGDVPFAGDWDCDGVDTPGLYRQSDGYVYLRNSNTQGIADVSFFFGNPGDVPIAGDFNNNGCDTVSIYRPSQGRVFIINKLGSGDAGLGVAELDYYFGNPGDTPFTGDFNNDGTDTVGLYRESTGSMYFRNSHTQGIADFDFFFGNPGDRFVGGDWTGDGTDSPGVFRPTQATFYLKHTNTQGNADVSFAYGNANNYPVAGKWGDIPAIRDIELHFSRPTDGDTVFHTEPVTASVGGGSGARVDLAVDGTVVGSAAIVNGTATIEWDTTRVADGSHTLTATLRNGSGVELARDEATVEVANLLSEDGG